MYSRILALPQKSFFLFGPRGTGKSVWLAQRLGHAALNINLLKSGEYLRYKRDPSLLAQEVAPLKNQKAWIIIDEVQKLPELLMRFMRCCSRVGMTTGLPCPVPAPGNSSVPMPTCWRAELRRKRCFRLSALEIGKDFRLPDALCYGQLPLSVTSSSSAERIEFLDAYVESYLKEEIQQEALVRNLNGFYRFLSVAAMMNGQILNIANVARDVGVARSPYRAISAFWKTRCWAGSCPPTATRPRSKRLLTPSSTCSIAACSVPWRVCTGRAFDNRNGRSV